MRDFFRGWRRKVAVVALVMALVVFGAWMRSRFAFEGVAFTARGHQHMFATAHDSLWWWHGELRDDDGEGADVGFSELLSLVDVAIRQAETRHFATWRIPLWCITLPLTLIAAQLLWPQRKRPPQG